MAIKNIHEVKECPECGSDNIMHNDEEQQVICRDCGLIYEPLTPESEEEYEAAAGIEEPEVKIASKKSGKKK